MATGFRFVIRIGFEFFIYASGPLGDDSGSSAANAADASLGKCNVTKLVGGGYGDDLTLPNFRDTNGHSIALTYDGKTANLYADGVLKATSAKT